MIELAKEAFTNNMYNGNMEALPKGAYKARIKSAGLRHGKDSKVFCVVNFVVEDHEHFDGCFASKFYCLYDKERNQDHIQKQVNFLKKDFSVLGLPDNQINSKSSDCLDECCESLVGRLVRVNSVKNKEYTNYYFQGLVNDGVADTEGF
tara:strand:+ start:29 stop:475 length:447 start_codon:yes stop_codon:yes gene_type:complete